MKTSRLLLPLIFGTIIAIALFLGAGWQANHTANAATSNKQTNESANQLTIRYVATTGSDTTDCTNSANPCATIQYAVDQADAGDEIRVAGGEYMDVHARPRNDFSTTGLVDQIVYLTKTVTIRGGYTTADWTLSDPEANPTTLDAQYQGRGVYITGPINPALEGLRIVRGSADGQKGSYSNFDAGGGIYIYQASLSLFESQVLSNTNTTIANSGSAVFLYEGVANFVGNIFQGNTNEATGTLIFVSSEVTLISNEIISNTSGSGTGVYLGGSTSQIFSNTFMDNGAPIPGSTLYLDTGSGNIQNNAFINNYGNGINLVGFVDGDDTAIVHNNYFLNNVTNHLGGAISASYMEITITHNIIISNTAGFGGGIHLLASNTFMENNLIAKNNGGWAGGGMHIDANTTIYSKNDVIVDNYIVDGNGSAIFMDSMGTGVFQMFHPTIANNHGGDETGIFLLSGSFTATNGILAGQDTGFHMYFPTGGSAHFEATLWDNTTNITGTGPITTGTINLYGDPGFLDPANGDYHLGPNSPAIDAGIDAGVTTDIDGDPRPSGAGFDIGADEIPGTIRYVATTGSDTTDCSNSANPCATIQYAVDQADAGDEIRVAGGEYTDVHVRNDPYPSGNTLTQTVFISQPLTLRGGYTPMNWTTSDPVADPTTINPQGQGRGILVINANQVLVENLRVVNGIANDDYSGGGLGIAFSEANVNGSWIEGNTGSGIGANVSTVILHSNVITGNFGSIGGGVSGDGSTLTMTQNTVIGNVVTGLSSFGGGIYLQYGRAYLAGNTVINNSSTWEGGGIWLAYNSETLVVSNTISSNTAEDHGGGLMVGVTTGSDVIVGNTITGNSAGSFGGGAFVGGEDVTFQRNVVLDNYAFYRGGGLYTDGNAWVAYNEFRGNEAGFDGGGITAVGNGIDQLSLVGNLIISNTASQGGGVFAEGTLGLINNIVADNYVSQSEPWNTASGVFVNGTVTLLHNTIANNQGGNGVGVMLQWNDTANLVDNIIISHTIGISVSVDSIANLDATLWGNETDWMGNGTITTGTINLWGNPGFIDPVNGDYHIGPDSIARDAGMDAGITNDIDDNPRPQGTGFDIGADEVLAVYLPIGIVQLQGRTDHSGAVVTAWSDNTIVATTTTDSSGAYSLSVPDGVYKITIEMPLYLDAVKTNVLISNASSTALSSVTLKGGDANDSDKINILDLSLIGAHYGQGCTDPNWDARADINHDCLVNLLDLVLAAGNFGKTSPVLWE